MIDYYFDGSSQAIRNVCKNPRFAVDNAGWTSGAVMSSVARASDTTTTSGFSGQFISTGSATLDAYIYYAATFNIPVRPGMTVTAIARIKQVSGTLRSVHLRLIPRSSGGTSLGDIVGSATTLTILNTWGGLSVTGTMPVNADHVQLQARIPFPTNSGEEFRIDSVMIVTGAAQNLTYADGDTPGWQWADTAGASESVGYPLPLNFIPDTFGMTGWVGGGSYTQTIQAAKTYPASDSRLVPGCPMPAVYVVNQFDNRLSNTAQWYPTSLGYQSWLIEGWAAAPVAISNNLTLPLRFGTAYQNVPPANDYIRVGAYSATVPALLPDGYRSWKRFRAIVSFTLPAGAAPYLTPNFDGADWQIAGITIRRTLQGDTNSY